MGVLIINLLFKQSGLYELVVSSSYHPPGWGSYFPQNNWKICIWPCDFPGHQRLSVPSFLFVRKRFQPSWPSLSSKRRFEQLLVRERRGCRAKNPSEVRLKKLIKIRRPPEVRLHWTGLAHTLILSAAPPLNSCYKTPHPILSAWDT